MAHRSSSIGSSVALALALMTGCGDQAEPAASTTSAPASASDARDVVAHDAAPLDDLVFTLTGRIEAGVEAQFCMFIQMPTESQTAVHSAESHYTPGSHHFLVTRTTLTEIPEGGTIAHLCGQPEATVAVSGGPNGIGASESIMGANGSYYEAQVPDARRDLPPGVAHVFQPGEVLLITAHYLNTSERTIDSQIELRLHRMEVDAVEQEAGTFFLLNTQLNIPPHMATTTTRSCPITKDLNLGLLWSHMHARGHSFRAWTDDAQATEQLGGDVYDEPGPEGWAEPHVQTYPTDPPITLHAGSNLMISCTYHNTTDRSFRFGQSAETNEMCLLHGMYWPRVDPKIERCENGVTTTEEPTALEGEDAR